MNKIDFSLIVDSANKVNNLLKEDKYISINEYKSLTNEFIDLITELKTLKNHEVLKEYCNKNSFDYETINIILSIYENIDKLVELHNDSFLNSAKILNKQYLDDILKKVDTNILLDENQRNVILTDDDRCLVVAGAGAGKTTTVAAKVKYLVEKLNVDPKKILVISFTNKAVKELAQRINKDLKIDCPVTTFHSTGNAIIRKEKEEKLNIFDSSKLDIILDNYFKDNILKNEKMVDNLILFFGTYFNAPFEGNKLKDFLKSSYNSKFETLKSELNEYNKIIYDIRSKQNKTIKNEILRSKEEVMIANFLYLNNIEYDYEPIYPYNITYSRKPYTPDFVIRQNEKVCYIEHFGISESGHNNLYTELQLKKYIKSIKDKILIHKKHDTNLIYTHSSYKDKRNILEHLKEKLIEKGFDLTPKPNMEVMKKIVSLKESTYISKLVFLVQRFIKNFKSNGYTIDDFDILYNKTNNVRNRLFLDIAKVCYMEYQQFLTENSAVDFEDMINESNRLLNNAINLNQKIDFDYIIVDEYQDISKQRFDLVKSLSKICDAKIVAVGDDWQSIYAFSGSDISLFTKFEENLGKSKILKIVNTYRNSQEIIDIAGNFVQKNDSQIKKQLISPKHIKDPVIIYTYDNVIDKTEKVSNKAANCLENALDELVKYNEKSNVLVLGRYGFDAYQLALSEKFEYINRTSRLKSKKYPDLKMTFMTAHASKGLGFDDVIIINAKNSTYGFPSKIDDDPVLNLVVKQDRTYDYAEERRLFYVALTRTKNRVFIIAPSFNPSEFVVEICKEYDNVAIRGKLNNKVSDIKNFKPCPVCGYPLIFRYKESFGLSLHICTNEPELCGFMTNDLRGKKISIQKCNKCNDGFLILKSRTRTKGLLMGCTNYKPNGKGCDNIINIYEDD